jgi:hypothetical protein
MNATTPTTPETPTPTPTRLTPEQVQAIRRLVTALQKVADQAARASPPERR